MKFAVSALLVLSFFPIISRSETNDKSRSETNDKSRSETNDKSQPQSEMTDVAAFPATPEVPDGWSALPRGRPFPVLPSDPRDLKLGLRKNTQHELEADVGGYRSLAAWKSEGWISHFGIEGAAYFQLRQEGAKFPLASSDGLIGAYAETVHGPWAYQFRYTHISAHLADGLYGVRSAFVYTREFAVLRAAYQLGNFRPYVGYQVLTHSAPVLPKSSLQLGGYEIMPHHWGVVHPYFGGDLKVHGTEEGTTFQLQAGVALVSESEAFPILLTANYLKGHDLRGQFYYEKLEKWSFGLDLEI
jgi:hypothetical protein